MHRTLAVATAVIVVVIAGCGGGDDPVAGDGDVVPETTMTTAATIPASTAPSVVTTLAATTTSVVDTVSDAVTTTAKAGCELEPTSSLLEARRTPASPYFVHQPAESSTDTPTVMFIPGGSTGTRNAAERVWENYLSNGEGVDDFRIVIPYADDYDLIDDEIRMIAIVDEVLMCYGSDPSRFHIAGFSQGGQIAFNLMLRQPELFATLLGAPGEFFRIEPERWREELAGKAVFNGVGENDEEWKPYVSDIHEGLVEAGIESVYVEFRGEGHRLSPEFDESIFFDFWSSH